MSEYIQVTTTTDNEREAAAIARELVERRLAACVQVVGPIASTYRWRGEVETAREWQCHAKTRRELYADLEATIQRMHSYDVPEIIAVELIAGSVAYLKWLEDQM